MRRLVVIQPSVSPAFPRNEQEPLGCKCRAILSLTLLVPLSGMRPLVVDWRRQSVSSILVLCTVPANSFPFRPNPSIRRPACWCRRFPNGRVRCRRAGKRLTRFPPGRRGRRSWHEEGNRVYNFDLEHDANVATHLHVWHVCAQVHAKLGNVNMQTSDDQSGKVADGRVGHGRVDVSALNSDSDNTFRIFKRKTCDVTSNLVCRPSLSVYNGRWAGERKRDW